MCERYKKIAVIFTELAELTRRWPTIMCSARKSQAMLYVLRGIPGGSADGELLFSEMRVLQSRLLATHLPFELRYMPCESLDELGEYAITQEADLIWMPKGRLATIRGDRARVMA